MPRIVSIQFITAGKLYDFNAGDLDLAPGDRVIVETERGLGIGTVLRGPEERDAAPDLQNLVSIRRRATPDDLAALERNKQLEHTAFAFCLKRIMERKMPMKLVRVEYQFDGSKAVFYFTADGRVDFRDLVKDLAHTFHTRIEMRQIGVRDESKMTGGIGICGRELCCCSFLREFQPVSVKMAKEQNLALNPSKISGQCGRLLCCLDYEYETYCRLRKNFPKCGKRVRTSSTAGTVDKINILTGAITLKQDDHKLVTVSNRDLLPDGVEPPPPQPELPGQQRPHRACPEQGGRVHTQQPLGNSDSRMKEQLREEVSLVTGPDGAHDAHKKPEKRRRTRLRKHGHHKGQGGGGTPPPSGA